MNQTELRIRVLGGAELVLGGRPLAELASAKAAALLFYLAVTGTGHSRSALAGLLWSDLPEPSARANLRLVLTKLRRVLPEHVAVTRQGVALDDRPGVWVDAAEVARAAAGPDDAGLLDAVRLCRGDLLAGFDVAGAPLFDDWQAAQRAATRADMLALMDRAVRWAADHRDAAAGIAVARRMLALEPLHEPAHRALMWFLAEGGRPSAALAQYETCRYLLNEELGGVPSADTVGLRDEIAGTGGFTRLGAAPAPSAEPGRAAPGPPRPLTSLIGRGAELARLDELLDDPACRLVTLVGPGGIGKTRLAIEVAAARRHRHRDGAVFVPFAGAGPAGPDEAAGLVVADLARVLGLSMAVPRDPLDLLAEHLSGRELLLVLDNLEHLDGAAGVIDHLLRRAPGTQVLVTSRRRLGLGAEWLVEVPGLPCPPPGAGADGAGYAAVQLFEERARLLRPGFAAGADPEGTARVCRLVSGVPLAIELAARWVRSARPAAIADRLGCGLELLETTAPDVEQRHRSVRAVIGWSWRLLTDEEERALLRLAVFRGGFDLDAAAAVAGAGLPLLAGLVDQSLVTAGEDGRYDMHELLRQYAAERLAADAGQESRARRRHAEHYAALLPAPAEFRAEDPGFPDAEADNLRAATELLVRDADPATLDEHLLRIWSHHRHLGRFREAQAALGAALDRPDGTRLQRGRWHRMLGEAHQQLGAAVPARDHLERALDALDSPMPGSAPGRLAVFAAEMATRALRGLRPGGRAARPRHRAVARERSATDFAISEVYWVHDEQLAVLPSSIRALNEAERAGDLEMTARAQAGLGMVLGAAGFRRLARRHIRAACAAAERSSNPITICWVGIMSALHGIGAGDWAAVDAGTARALALREETPMYRWADELLLASAVAWHLAARHEQAAAAAAEGVAAGAGRRDPIVHLWGLLVGMETALRTDPCDPDLPRRYSEAVGLLPTANRADAARVHVAGARLHLAAGRTAQAWQAVRAADDLLGAGPSFEQYALEAHAGVPELCLTLLELGGDHPGPAELRATAAASARRLRRYARRYPMARPRALLCLARQSWLDGRAAARRACARAAREAERLRMPYELARAHEELGRHLPAGRRSPLGLDGAEHRQRAIAGFRAVGCGPGTRGLAGLPVRT
ncbi:ATP-binding protein [Actinoplanes sp. NPDC049668]|uniref:ATP-binding protein n=1 Tax=unclassified Actinoplanes TaxID=2626549 RepID=UPI0033BA59AB